ncbi:TspO/MBR family protein [Liquorilactobacillus satsumensis]|uniref:Tryptophan-rich sensory protein n=1 Tax=Liquorilactobacillus satsumensis DSM 16230 = JCM 12392 TaxID=1423801 RepID=A0A0R1UVW6_9LACO|nr:TspO/MBR family protein [Liquorilactobacillus satsumensis]KRL97404.1 tryptophan-rich sensory protein [Liquorilactobacillus satsumensis DSM 16230 = JCM 12392]MCC7667287.1 tryptophan-rich sensory protein [Liquorilactobacillus satsumensis]MCP9312412.1 tryptophan-rich sensory protein [Liquorilactobacillus satsumensis]MCP9327613.1 tryptophan-rich sensory protein [Liquorilactobacillus satsumensis]MCP9357115.1 tryptophan-rich sensory protein [Liquorilactobacillus satsumensis]
MQSKRKQFLSLLLTVLVVEAIGSLSALFAGNIKQTYLSLKLPLFSPPASLFGIVWPLLYLLIGVSGYLFFSQKKPRRKQVVLSTLFGLQLLVNFSWSIVFFAGGHYWWGFLLIVILDLLVLCYLLEVYPIHKGASILFYPYFAWLLFATYLTLGVAILN